MKQLALIVIALLLCALPNIARGGEKTGDEGTGEEGIRLTVDVFNGTPNGKPVVGDEISITVYHHEEIVSTFQGTVDADGKAFFNNIPRQEHLVLFAKVKHEGMFFSGNGVSVDVNKKHLHAHVQVFEVSYDNSLLTAVTHHLKIAQRGNSIVLSEFILLRNPSDYAISATTKDDREQRVVLTIPLPERFEEFNSAGYFEPDALVFNDEGFYDTMAVPPGDQQLIFSYELAVASTMDIVKKISLPTSSVVIFSQLEPGVIQGLGKPDGKLIMPDGIASEYYDLSSLQPGAQIEFKITGLIVNYEKRDSWIAVVAVFSILAILVLIKLLTGKSHGQTSPEQ